MKPSQPIVTVLQFFVQGNQNKYEILNMYLQNLFIRHITLLFELGRNRVCFYQNDTKKSCTVNKYKCYLPVTLLGRRQNSIYPWHNIQMTNNFFTDICTKIITHGSMLTRQRSLQLNNDGKITQIGFNIRNRMIYIIRNKSMSHINVFVQY